MINNLTKVCIYIIFFTGIIWAQDESLKTSHLEDSIYIQLKPKILPLKDWHKFEVQKLQMEYEKIELEQLHPISPNIMPSRSWELDIRGSSYYVPRMVRDKLNLIMNRPNDTAFIPVLTVAFIALQMANQYLLVRKKTQIDTDNLLAAANHLTILKELWKSNPQTISHLYQNSFYKKSITLVELQKIMEILLDNKLVKMKTIPKAETQYFPALNKMELGNLIDHCVSDSSCTNSDRSKLLNILIQLKKEE